MKILMYNIHKILFSQATKIDYLLRFTLSRKQLTFFFFPIIIICMQLYLHVINFYICNVAFKSAIFCSIMLTT